MMLNHGSASLYQRLIAKSRAAGARTAFMGVNSGSSQIAAALGPLAQGMVFAQVVPSPWERKHALARESQDAMRRARLTHPAARCPQRNSARTRSRSSGVSTPKPGAPWLTSTAMR